jgi:hypothetical protein
MSTRPSKDMKRKGKRCKNEESDRQNDGQDKNGDWDDNSNKMMILDAGCNLTAKSRKKNKSI